MERFLGYRRDDIIGKYAYEMQALFPEHLERGLSNIKRMLEGKTISASAEYGFIAKDGTRKYGDISGAPMIRDEKIIGVTCVVRDITDRKRMEEEIRALAITDPLTGLYNRRGFLALADQQLKIAERAKKCMLLVFADLDGMKQINDSLGHKTGDEALVEVSRILKAAFRKADIVARMGGDEFAILALGASMDYSSILTDRMQQEIEIHNADEKKGYSISLSLGMDYYDPEHPSSIDDLMSRADEEMYAQKRNKKTIRNASSPLSRQTHLHPTI
jgi:diguanylate cyclase (GGDEF)-like protein/PAS domain S-box-containing protein